jgi:hypothetical protein
MRIFACRPRQLHAAVAATHGLEQAGLGEHIDDLEDVLLGDVEALGQHGDLDQLIVRRAQSSRMRMAWLVDFVRRIATGAPLGSGPSYYPTLEFLSM